MVRVTHMKLHCNIMENARLYFVNHGLDVFMREDPAVNPEILIEMDKLASLSVGQVINGIICVFSATNFNLLRMDVTEVEGVQYLVFSWK